MVERKLQTTFMGAVVERYYCIHCNWMGYEYLESGDHELCPKCGWVVYSDSEVKEDYLNSNIYPKLAKKYRKVHKIRLLR